MRLLRFRHIIVGICLVAACVGGPAASAALIDGLQVYYSFDNDTASVGGVKDLSGNGRNASPIDQNANTTFDVSFSSDVPGVIGSGKSLSLIGADHLEINSPSDYAGVLGSTSRTISMWVKNTSVAQMVYAEWGTNTTGNRFTFRQEQASNQPTAGASKIGGIRTEIQGDYRTTASAGPAVNDGSWHHILTVFNADGTPTLDDVMMYVDGNLVAVADNTSTPTLDTLANIVVTIGGGHPTGLTSRPYVGLIDEVGIWNRALDSSEIAALAGGAVVIPEPGVCTLLAIGGGLMMGQLVRRRKTIKN